MTVAAGRRYVLDWRLDDIDGAAETDPDNVFYGAIVKYTCTSPCVP